MKNLKTQYMTRNDCYTAGRKITPRGIMVHSTATPGVMAARWFSLWNKSFRAGEINRQACVHAFLDDKEVWQYLPWNHRGWHGGGSANDTHISFEICEPAGHRYNAGSATMIDYDVKKNAEYFRAAWQNAVALCVMLCKMYNLNETHICDHFEGHRRGIASNSGDVNHWFPRHGESMDTFRAAVRAALGNTSAPATPAARPTIRRGDRGDHVRHMQIRLVYHDFPVAVDGIFGPDSEDKLKRFQYVKGLLVDGVCGPITWAALEAAKPPPIVPPKTEESETMSKEQEQFNRMFAVAMAAYNKERGAQSPSGWGKDNWDKMCALGMFDGTSPRSPLTREQAATLLTRIDRVL